jgi:hypothetical protein
MFDLAKLRRLAEWEPIGPHDEALALSSANTFAAALNRHSDLKAEIGDHTYNNYIPVYVYVPAEVVRHAEPNGYTRANYQCVLLYFHHLAAVAAMGFSSWGETLRPDGTWSSRGYGGLDLPELISPSQIPSDMLRARISEALEGCGYLVASPDYLRQDAPQGFEPLQRSEGMPPWNKLFHLLFQFND